MTAIDNNKTVETEISVIPDHGFSEDAIAHAGAILEGPLLVSEDHFNTFMMCIRSTLRSDYYPEMVFQSGGMQTDEDYWDASRYMVRHYRPYNVSEGILTIPVRGSLVSKFGYQFGSWMTGYEYIERAVERGITDPEVRGIALNIDSPGGTVSGNFELSQYIVEQRSRKPIRAFANDLALSGGFSIATAAEDVVVSNSGRTGSVGVVASHLDVSQMLSMEGIKVSYVFAGKHKLDGAVTRPLSKGARERMQSGVNKSYDRFVRLVADNRNISYDSVRETEAMVFDPEESVEAGFADRIGDFRKEINTFASENSITITGAKMTTQATNEPGKAEETVIDTEKLQADARKEERARFQAVNASDEYKGREALAAKLLGTTNMTSEAIIEVLGTAERKPDEKAEGSARNHFKEAMDKDGKVGVEAGADPEEEIDGALADDGRTKACHGLLSSYQAAGGHIPQKSKAA